MTAKRRCNHKMIVPSFCFYPSRYWLQPSRCSVISRLSCPMRHSRNNTRTPAAFASAKPLLVNHHKVIFCLTLRIVRHFQPHRCAGHQQFPAAPGVFHMNGFYGVIHIHMRNKAVRTVDEYALNDLSVLHATTLPDTPLPSCYQSNKK